MTTLNLEYFGLAGAHQKIVPGNTATAIDANCLTYREFFLKVDGVDAGSTEPTACQWIVGQTSGARAILVSYVLDAGAWGNANARVTLRLRSMSGTFAAAENIGIGANLNHLTVRDPLNINPCPPGYLYDGMTAKVALIEVYGNTALCDWIGAIPDQTSLIGIPLASLMSIVLRDTNSINYFKCIDYVAGSASAVQVKLYF